MIRYGIPIRKEHNYPYNKAEMKLNLIQEYCQSDFNEQATDIDILQLPSDVDRLLLIITLSHAVSLKDLQTMMQHYNYEINQGLSNAETIHWQVKVNDIVHLNYRK